MKVKPNFRRSSPLLPLKMLALLLAVATAGCVVPTVPVRRVVSGQQYSGDSIAFLKEPRTSREDTIASLGPPTYESNAVPVLAYVWSTTTPHAAWFVGIAGPNFASGKSGTWASSNRRVLYIAFDADGFVTRSEVCPIAPETSLETGCVSWARVQ